MPVDVEYSNGAPVMEAEIGGQKPNLPLTSRRGPYFLVAHQGQWTLNFDEDGVPHWLPNLSAKQWRAGVQGATAGNPLPFLTYLLSQGYVDLTKNHDMQAVCGGTTMRVHEMQDGGKHYAPPWELIGVRAGRTRKDEAEELHWKARLKAAELLGGMNEETLEDIQRPKVARLANLRIDRSGGVNIQAMVKALEEEIDAGRQAWERQFGKSKAKKTRKKSTASAASNPEVDNV